MKAYCPHCNHYLDGYVGLDTQDPKNGDVSFCVYCGGLSVFDDGLRNPTADERAMFDRDERIRVATEKWLEWRKQLPNTGS